MHKSFQSCLDALFHYRLGVVFLWFKIGSLPVHPAYTDQFVGLPHAQETKFMLIALYDIDIMCFIGAQKHGLLFRHAFKTDNGC